MNPNNYSMLSAVLFLALAPAVLAGPTAPFRLRMEVKSRRVGPAAPRAAAGRCARDLCSENPRPRGPQCAVPTTDALLRLPPHIPHIPPGAVHEQPRRR